MFKFVNKHIIELLFHHYSHNSVKVLVFYGNKTHLITCSTTQKGLTSLKIRKGDSTDYFMLFFGFLITCQNMLSDFTNDLFFIVRIPWYSLMYFTYLSMGMLTDIPVSIWNTTFTFFLHHALSIFGVLFWRDNIYPLCMFITVLIWGGIHIEPLWISLSPFHFCLIAIFSHCLPFWVRPLDRKWLFFIPRLSICRTFFLSRSVVERTKLVSVSEAFFSSTTMNMDWFSPHH